MLGRQVSVINTVSTMFDDPAFALPEPEAIPIGRNSGPGTSGTGGVDQLTTSGNDDDDGDEVDSAAARAAEADRAAQVETRTLDSRSESLGTIVGGFQQQKLLPPSIPYARLPKEALELDRRLYSIFTMSLKGSKQPIVSKTVILCAVVCARHDPSNNKQT